MEPTGKRWPAIFVRQEGRDRRGQYECYHVYGEMVCVYENGCVRNISWDYLRDDNATLGGLHNLRISCQGNVEQRDRGVYAWETEYYEASYIDLPRVRAMAKTLETIDRGMKRMAKEWGDPSTYGQYVLRVAKAIGAKELIFQSKRCKGRSYDEMDLHRRDLAEGASHIDWWVREWQAETKEEPCPTH